MKAWQFAQKQALPYEAKLAYANLKAREFFEYCQGDVFVSVGGLDSITLAYFLWHYINPYIPAVSVSVLEEKSVQAIHKQMPNMMLLKPSKSKVEVITEYGYPIISKTNADKIEQLQNPTEKNETIRHAILTGETGKQGRYKNSRYMKLSERWQRLFVQQQAPFRVSGKCCYYMKEKPCDQYSRQVGRSVYMGLMAAEHGRREISLIKHGCNYYGKTVTRSCPFAIFSKTDLLRLALQLHVPVPAIYGEIIELPDGKLTTSRATRTGCNMCGFGIHMERRPHRFDRLRHDNPKEWSFWMYDMGWGRVLNYIGVEWEDEVEVQGDFFLHLPRRATS